MFLSHLIARPVQSPWEMYIWVCGKEINRMCCKDCTQYVDCNEKNGNGCCGKCESNEGGNCTVGMVEIE